MILEGSYLEYEVALASLLHGHFRLRSGQESEIYLDKYRFECDSLLLYSVARAMCHLLPPHYSYLVGLEMGGIPLAVAMSLQNARPTLFLRKQAKQYGTCNQVEGEWYHGSTVVVIEDVITTAGQVVTAVNTLRGLGMGVLVVVCAVDRQQGGAEALESIGCELRPAFTLAALEEALKRGGNHEQEDSDY